MTSITIYDTDFEDIEKCAEGNDTTEAEVISMLMEYFADMMKDNDLK